MLAAAAFCPHPPVLVPGVAGDAGPELDSVRAACRVAVGRMLDARPELIVVVGDGPATGEYGRPAGGTLAGYGVPVRFGPPPAVLPLSLTVGRWLLERCSSGGDADAAIFVGVAANAAPADCLSLGATLGARAGRVGMLVMGDGSANRDHRVTGRVDRRGHDYDAHVAAAVASADVGALARLDEKSSHELRVAGRAAWQVLAGAADGPFAADLLVHTAPYGVGYLVASWAMRA